MTPGATTAMAPGLRAVIGDVVVEPTGLRAHVGPHVVEASYSREMTRVLSEAVYNVFHAGQSLSTVPSRLRDRTVEARLRTATPHTTARAIARVAEPTGMSTPGPDQVLVEHRGVRVWVPREAFDPGSTVEVGSVLGVALPAARPAVSPGHFLVEGSIGWRRPQGVLRLYLHLESPEAAIQLWGRALDVLERSGRPYRAKVLTAAEFYPRRDACVVYLEDTDREVAHAVVENVVDRGLLADETSAFTQRCGAGAALAAEPADPDPVRQGLSFGQHRATVLATALLAAAESQSEPEEEVRHQYLRAGIDPGAPWRNTPQAG